jgi:hypothetical protein
MNIVLHGFRARHARQDPPSLERFQRFYSDIFFHAYRVKDFEAIATCLSQFIPAFYVSDKIRQAEILSIKAALLGKLGLGAAEYSVHLQLLNVLVGGIFEPPVDLLSPVLPGFDERTLSMIHSVLSKLEMFESAQETTLLDYLVLHKCQRAAVMNLLPRYFSFSRESATLELDALRLASEVCSSWGDVTY